MVPERSLPGKKKSLPLCTFSLLCTSALLLADLLLRITVCFVVSTPGASSVVRPVLALQVVFFPVW